MTVGRSNKGTLRVPQDLERYRSLVDDWPGFATAVSRPLPRCVRIQTQRIAAGELETLLTADGIQPRPLAWTNGAFRLGCSEGLGRRWWYLAGLCHSQEEASMLPVQLLDPRPGDRVLDLCAAPGSKTAQIALALESEGTVVANDSSVSRLRALRSTLDRLGLANVSVTRCEGSVFPRGCGTFDRILVDAPCAGDGTSRRRPDARRAGLDRDYTRVQKRLLRRAVRLCRPGGRIVYSTCSFAPEENEMVVDAILGEDSRRELKLVASKVTGLKTAHGVTSWRGTDLHPELRLAVRLWPHHNDTGGFFVALLEKSHGPLAEANPQLPLATASSDEWRSEVGEWFGIEDEIWQRFIIHRSSARRLHLTNRDHAAPASPFPVSVGLPFLKTGHRYPKLSTAAALLLAGAANRNVVELEPDQVEAYHEGRAFAINPAQTQTCTATGYVITRHRGHGLGVALHDTDARTLRSLFAARWKG